MKVFVTGGTGFLGINLVEALISKKVEVTCLTQKDLATRKPNAYKLLKESKISQKQGDITKLDDLRLVLDEDYDVLFNLAGVVGRHSDEDYERINVKGLANLLQTVQGADVDIRKIVHMSSISAMGPIKSEEPLNEETTPNPLTPYQISKRKGEQLIEEFSQKSGIPATIIRAPMIYGAGERSGLLRFSKMIARGTLPVPGSEAFMPVVYVKNLVDALLLSSKRTEKRFNVYIVSDARNHKFSEIAENIATNLKIRPLRLKVPIGLLRFIPRKPEYLEFVINNVRLSIDKVIKELGYKPEDRLEQGLKETVQYYILKGLLTCRNFPVSPFESLRIGLNENEGLGTAYEYYVKTKILTSYLRRIDEIQEALVISLPRVHGSVADIVSALKELGIHVSTMEDRREEEILSLQESFDLVVVVGDFLTKVKDVVTFLKRHSKGIILFTTNSENIFHVTRWSGTNIKQIAGTRPVLFDYLDCPPFPSGVKMFAGRVTRETSALKLSMLGLTLWSYFERKLPGTAKSRLSHMVASMHC